MDNHSLRTKSEQIRANIKTAILSSGGGHAGGSLSCADVLAALYGAVMNHDPSDPRWEGRDRLILSKGHSGLGLYAALAAFGYFPESEMATFGQEDSRLMNHPDCHRIPGVEMSTGSLGHGISLATGIALAGKMKGQEHFTYCILGDGECCEGSVWESAMTASTRKLSRLCVIVDRNLIGNDGFLDREVELEPMAAKWESFGFRVSEVDGHDPDAIAGLLLKQKEECAGPYAVIAHTVKGCGLIDTIAGTGASHYISGTEEKLIPKFKF